MFTAYLLAVVYMYSSTGPLVAKFQVITTVILKS
jgi:hypothetical protein